MEFRILGPLEVWSDGQRVPVTAAKQRTLLATLLLRAGRVVAADELIDGLWDERPPTTARKTLHNYVHRLRAVLAHGASSPPMLLTQPPGYLLNLRDAELDLHRFEELVDQARLAAAGDDAESAAEQLRQALSLWRGPALADVASETLRTEAAWLEERRLAAVEARIDAELGLGRHAELVGELEALVALHPLRERFCGQLMLALYRCGRQVDALGAYRAARKMLAEEFGVEPAPYLQRLERAILAADPSLAAPARPVPSAPTQHTAPAAQARDRVVPAQLPADVVAFTGRTQQLQGLDRLLEPGAKATAVVVTTIAGTAGVGKTALAVHWAHQVRQRFPDGQLYVNLHGFAPGAPTSPLQALAQLLCGLGVVAEQVPMELEQAAGLYRSLLAPKYMLIVLDNARSAEQVRPLLPGGPGCVVLVTSRDRLDGLVATHGAGRLTLDVLTPEEAVGLLAHVLGKHRLAAEPDAGGKLAAVCGLLPLALRIAAANLVSQSGQSISGYVARLRQGERLTELTIEGDPQTGVRTAFGCSYATLDADVQRLFRLLGLVPGPEISAPAAAALAGMPVGQAARLLERLAVVHLVEQRAPGRFGFHDLLRLYAAERAHDEDSEPDRQAAMARLCNHYLHTVDAAARLLYPGELRLPLAAGVTPPGTVFGDHTQALAWLASERPNLVAAVRHAAAHGPQPAAWLLADALRGYFWRHVHGADWSEVASAALRAAQAASDLRAQAAARLSLADAHHHLCQYHPAVEQYTQALTLYEQLGWQEGQATALGNLGIVYRRMGRLHEAVAHHAQTLAIGRQIGWLAGQGTSLGELGETYHALGRLDQALHHLTQALSLFQQTGDECGRSEALRALAAVHRDAGRYLQADELARSALSLARDVGGRCEMDALITLATVHFSLARHCEAIDDYEHALGLAREATDRYPEAEALIGLAATHRCLGDPSQAFTCVHRTITIARQAGFRTLEGLACTVLAELYLDQDHPVRALQHAKQACDLHRRTGHRLGQARALVVLGRASRQTDAARRYWQEAFALFTDIGSPEASQVRALLDSPA
jgi:DNA-binding SARP family transcriptional activator